MRKSGFRPVDIRPGMGGHLLSDISKDTIGETNYAVKRNWRRVLDRERVCEGYDYFQPNTDFGVNDQPFPLAPDNDEPITLQITARRPNGEEAFICGTPTRLFRFNYSAAVWEQIGSGFSADAGRWQPVNINGYLVLNNAVDLPVVFRVEWDEVMPLYELRDQGVASVGWIAEFNGALMLGNINEMTTAELAASRALIYSLTTTGSLVGTTFTASAGYFSTTDVGRHLVLTDQAYRIVAYISATQVTVDRAATAVHAASTFFITNPSQYGRLTGSNHIQYRLTWSKLDEPQRYAATATGTISAGSGVLKLDYLSRSFSVGQEIVVLGAGVGGGNLTATIRTFDGIFANLTVTATTAASNTLIQASDANTSIAIGFLDLQAEGSAIVGMLAMRDVLVVYKDGGIHLVRYTGVQSAPFDSVRIKGADENKSLYYANTLISAVDRNGVEFHLYAGRNAFYRFDLTTQNPQEMLVFESAKKDFFTSAVMGDASLVFSADNPITKEIFIFYPGLNSDHGLRYSYFTESLSTTDMACTAAAHISKPNSTPTALAERWFVLGLASGAIVLSGITDHPQSKWNGQSAIFYRRAAYPFTSIKSGYAAILRYGYGAYGSRRSEKDIDSYTVLFAEADDTDALVVRLYRASNPNQSPALLGTRSITPNANNIPAVFNFLFLQEEFTVTTPLSGPMEIAGKLLNVNVLDTSEISRL